MEDYSEKVMPLLSVNAIIVGPVVIDKVEQNGIVRQRAALILQTSFIIPRSRAEIIWPGGLLWQTGQQEGRS